MVQIKQQIVSKNIQERYTYDGVNTNEKLVFHETGNYRKNANAQMHADLQSRGNDREASWHVQSDDNEIIQSFPFTARCWAASSGENPKGGNFAGINWEMCVYDGMDFLKAVKLASKGVAKVMVMRNIPMSGLVRHYDEDPNKKECPREIMSGREGVTWDIFKQMVHYEIEVLKGNNKPIEKPNNQTDEKVYPELGTFYMNTMIYVSDKPSTKNRSIVAEYYKGESVKYHTVHIKNGYVWLQYDRKRYGKTFAQGYIPCRTYRNGKFGKIWGYIL